jgi:transcriptional regulator with XRE-family HTH domain
MNKEDRLIIAKKAKKLRREEGMNWKQIAEKFNKTPATLRNYREELKEYIEEYKEVDKKKAEHTGNILQKAIKETENIPVKEEKKAKKVKKTVKNKKSSQVTNKKIDLQSKNREKFNVESSKLLVAGLGFCAITFVIFLLSKVNKNKAENQKDATAEVIEEQVSKDIGTAVSY